MAGELGGLSAKAIVNTLPATQALELLQDTWYETGEAAKRSGKEADQAAKGFAAMANPSAAMFMTQFAFTIQDMPYFLTNMRMGIMSVSNNIGFMISQLGIMKSQLGAGQTMMQMLRQALTGPAGLVLGFSAVIAIIQSLSMVMGQSKKDTEEFDNALKSLAKTAAGTGSVDELNEALRRSQKLLDDTIAKQNKLREVREFVSPQTGTVVRTERITDQAAFDKLQSRIDKLQALRLNWNEMLDTARLQEELDAIAPEIQNTLNDLLAAEKEVARLQALIKKGILTEGDARVPDLLEKAQARVKELIESTADRQKRLADAQEKLDKKREEAAKKEKAWLDDIHEAHKKELETVVRGYEALYGFINDADIRSADKFEERRNKVEADFARDMTRIAVAEAETGNAERAEEARAARRKLLELELGDIKRDELEEEEQLREKIAREHEAALQREMDAIIAIGDMLDKVLTGGAESFGRKLKEALTTLARIIQLLKEKDALESKGEDSTSTWLSIGANILGLFGGESGGGGSPTPTPTPDIPQVSDIPMRAGGGSSGEQMMVQEIRALRADVRTMKIQQPIVFKGLLDAQRMVREELPAAQDFLEKKTLGKV